MARVTEATYSEDGFNHSSYQRGVPGCILSTSSRGRSSSASHNGIYRYFSVEQVEGRNDSPPDTPSSMVIIITFDHVTMTIIINCLYYRRWVRGGAVAVIVQWTVMSTLIWMKHELMMSIHIRKWNTGTMKFSQTHHHHPMDKQFLLKPLSCLLPLAMVKAVVWATMSPPSWRIPSLPSGEGQGKKRITAKLYGNNYNICPDSYN